MLVTSSLAESLRLHLCRGYLHKIPCSALLLSRIMQSTAIDLQHLLSLFCQQELYNNTAAFEAP